MQGFGIPLQRTLLKEELGRTASPVIGAFISLSSQMGTHSLREARK